MTWSLSQSMRRLWRNFCRTREQLPAQPPGEASVLNYSWYPMTVKKMNPCTERGSHSYLKLTLRDAWAHRSWTMMNPTVVHPQVVVQPSQCTTVSQDQLLNLPKVLLKAMKVETSPPLIPQQMQKNPVQDAVETETHLNLVPLIDCGHEFCVLFPFSSHVSMWLLAPLLHYF